jgi:hypothetical protein
MTWVKRLRQYATKGRAACCRNASRRLYGMPSISGGDDRSVDVIPAQAGIQ